MQMGTGDGPWRQLGAFEMAYDVPQQINFGHGYLRFMKMHESIAGDGSQSSLSFRFVFPTTRRPLFMPWFLPRRAWRSKPLASTPDQVSGVVQLRASGVLLKALVAI